MTVKDLLIEIGTEELPPKALKKLSASFSAGILDGLRAATIGYGAVQSFAAPRRLAIFVKDVVAQQADKAVERRGPALSAAFDADGMPTKATEGFARSCGVAVDALEQIETDKGAWLVHRSVSNGVATPSLVPEIVSKSLATLPIPKRMRWSDRDAEFVRPVHWVVMLWDEAVIDATVLGIQTGAQTRGHRFHHPKPLHIAEPAAYMPLLETEGHVMPDFAMRREAIFAQVSEAALQAGGKAEIDGDLLDEVTALVEWPSAVAGGFDARFLALPEEALISSMQNHQRYFPVRGGDGKLLPAFVTVANIESRDADVVRAGNERVIRPRLEDAMFFYKRDLAQPLDQRLDGLKNVVFQKQLGTLFEKTDRVTAAAGYIAQQLGCDGTTQDRIRRAAKLCKCDLLSEMVGEFPELQGIMGRYYATHQGEHDEIAQALTDHYLPRFAGDTLPQSRVGQAVALADKIDTLCGIFSVGLVPTGDKDPYALRRAALGVLRIIIECDLPLDLLEVLKNATGRLPAVKAAKGKAPEDVALAVFQYIMDRLRAYYVDSGVTADVFESVLARRPTQPRDFHRRIEAVTRFRRLPEADSLAAANKRIANILKQAVDNVPEQVDSARLVEQPEQALWHAVSKLTDELAPLWDSHQYEMALTRLATLRDPVDTFFDSVMVMTDDLTLRANRLALLASLNRLFLRVADISVLQR